jgi:hypothetical protein
VSPDFIGVSGGSNPQSPATTTERGDGRNILETEINGSIAIDIEWDSAVCIDGPVIWFVDNFGGSRLAQS